MGKCPISTLLKAGAPSDWEEKGKALTFTTSFGTSGLNSLCGPIICSHP